MPTTLLRGLAVLCLLPVSLSANAQAVLDDMFEIEGEVGPVWFSRNDVRIPSDEGTRFDMTRLTGSGPTSTYRFHATYEFNPRHALRLTVAPLEVRGVGLFEEAVRFRDVDFAANEPTRGIYRFSTYRLTYRWNFHRSERWRWGIGGAVLVRDARIELAQTGRSATDSDLGLVPLAHLQGAFRLGDRTELVLDVEGLAAPQGRALDATLRFRYSFPGGTYWSLGYRTLEGGADNSSLYTFAWLHYASLGIGYRF